MAPDGRVLTLNQSPFDSRTLIDVPAPICAFEVAAKRGSSLSDTIRRVLYVIISPGGSSRFFVTTRSNPLFLALPASKLALDGIMASTATTELPSVIGAGAVVW